MQMAEYFVSDYRPTKRIGIMELDGCLNMLSQAVDEAEESTRNYYRGALIALMCIRYHKFEYPRDFMAVFEKHLRDCEEQEDY